MATLTEDRPVAPGTRPTEVIVRVDHKRGRGPSLLGAMAVAAIALLLVFAISVANGWLNVGNLFSTSTTDRSAPVILHRLRNLSSYNASSGTFSVIVDVENDVSILPQFLAGSRVIYSGNGTVDAAVDLGALDAQHVVKRPDGSVLVTLPHATLERANLDLGRSHVMNRDRGLFDRLGGFFVDNPTSERALEHAALVKIDRAAKKTSLIARAESNTATMVKRLAAATGVDRIEVQFSDALVADTATAA